VTAFKPGDWVRYRDNRGSVIRVVDLPARGLVGRMPDDVCVCNITGRCWFVSPSFIRLATPQEVADHQLTQLAGGGL
jgi:hypothetical protein